FRQALTDGLGWGEAKQVLYERIESDVAPMRERYEAFMADPAAIEVILQQGAQKARAIATPKIAALREALGLRSSTSAATTTGRPKTMPKQGKMPRFTSFRDAGGNFRFRLFSADGEELLLSMPFTDPKTAGALQKRLKTLGAAAAVVQIQSSGMILMLDGEPVASTPDYRDESARNDALAQLHAALDQLAAQE
ncbi:MAG: tryptophan--tRNA ligase, partial [Rhodanobacter sp.]